MTARPHVHPNTRARIRRTVFARDGYRCLHCGWAPPVPAGYDGRYTIAAVCHDQACRSKRPGHSHLLELDHVLPHLLGGKFAVDNLQTLCNSCNVRKGARIA